MNNNKLDPIKILLSLVDPDYLDEDVIKELAMLPPDKKQNLMESTLKIAERNGLRYYFLQKLNEIERNLRGKEKSRNFCENDEIFE